MKRLFKMANYFNFLLVYSVFIVLVKSLPQELELGDSNENEIGSFEIPSTTTTTARPFKPLRPNRPLASAVHTTLQQIESIVVTAGNLAISLLDSLNPNRARVNHITDFKSNDITSNSPAP